MVKGQWKTLARMLGLHPYSFLREKRIFNDHRESGPWFKVSSEGWTKCFCEELQLQLLFICIAHFNAIVLPKVLHNLKENIYNF